MAMTGVLRPGHAQIRVLDMDESVQFYTNVLGLIETGRDNQGRVYFKAWDERDHNSVVLRQADRAGMDFFAFKVLDKATLEKLGQSDSAQTEINKIEAASGSLFVSGGRPFVVWVCAFALAYAAVIEPIARFVATVGFAYSGPFPVIDTDLTMQVLLGLLGLGAYRSVEKIKGVARQ